MEFIFLAGGVVIGSVITAIIKDRNKICGVIDVDHNNVMCKIRITSDELSNRRTKRAVFKINHDAKISREEQIL